MNMHPKRKPFGERLIETLKQGLADIQSGVELRTTRVIVPPDPPKFDGQRLVALREKWKMSQHGFAVLLNVSAKAVESWEQGVRRPNGAALRLLQVLEDPALFAQIVSEELTPAARKPAKRKSVARKSRNLHVAESGVAYKRSKESRK